MTWFFCKNDTPFGEKILSKDISVVVQGGVDMDNTPKCLASIRKYLPDAEIILSTWMFTNVEGLDYDEVIFNKDPGAYFYVRTDGALTPNNVNRQLVSVQSGLLKANRKYALKLRSDLILSSDKFLDYFDCFPARKEEFIFFQKRVIIPSVYTKKTSAVNGLPQLYHPSDWWFFGLTDDLKKYFCNTKLAEEPSFSCYKMKNPEKNPVPKTQNRMFAEQYYCVSAFKQKFKNIHFDDWTDYNDDEIKLSENLIMNNFIILDYKQHGILNKRNIRLLENHPKKKFFTGLYSYEIFKEDYKSKCL